MSDPDLDLRIAEILREKPSRDACLVQLAAEGYPPERARPAVEAFFEARRRATRERRQAEEEVAIVLGRLIEGAPLPPGIDPASLRDLAIERWRELKSRRRRWLLHSAGLQVAALVSGCLAVFAIATGLLGKAVLFGLCAAGAVLGASSYGMNAAKAAGRLDALGELARRYGWWEGRRP